MGINVDGIITLVFVIGSFLGAVGGLFIGLYYRGINFDMGWNYGLYAFVAAIIGGIGNIPGAMVGGILLGVFKALIAGYISSTWADAFTFILLIGIGAYTAAIFNNTFGLPILYSIPFAILIPAFFGIILAGPIIHLRGDYLLVSTIGWQGTKDITPRDITGLPPPIRSLPWVLSEPFRPYGSFLT